MNEKQIKDHLASMQKMVDAGFLIADGSSTIEWEIKDSRITFKCDLGFRNLPATNDKFHDIISRAIFDAI